ncbi:MAG: extracellular solute-binding protein [Geminicoccaceae bacterium]|nr:extracellular solute-binding protein [Geminicoccaceae bacterium]
MKAVFANWKRLLDADGFLENHPALDWQDAIPTFVQGKAAIYLMGNFAVAPMKEGGLTDDQIDFVQFPEIVEGVPMAEDAPTDTLHIPSGARNKADAKLFLAKPETQTKINATLGQLPVNNRSQVPDDKFLKQGFEMLQNAAGLAQFYDRDARAEMAKAGMGGFQGFMVKPDHLERILDRLEKVRQRTCE